MTATPRTPSKQPKARILFALALIIVLGLVAQRWWWGRSHVSSDNAQLEGHIVPIASRVSGYVLKVNAADNQLVPQGDVLLELDPRDYTVKLGQAEADYHQALAAAGKDGQPGEALARIGAAQATAAAANTQSGSVQAQIREAQANVDKAERDLQRNRELAKQKMISASLLDAAETTVTAAKARVSALEAQLKNVQESAQAAGQQVGVSSAGLKVAQAKVLAAESALQFARNQLGDTRVLAPAAGMVTKKAVEPGQMIQAGQTLMYLASAEQVWVTANLKETELHQVKIGQQVDVEVDAYPDLKLIGHVESFSPATGARFTLLPPDNATGNFTKVVQRVPVRIALDNPPATPRLLPGLSVNVTISTH
ncbi:HlyD family secretion protein [Uliginosibacterium flavum]|uniref:HlyD family secretion protein n=1 Tax=Uliginosibacterium flavum TaxID=1396831 RepID=A0ABV2TGZ3_9RHOO